MTAEDLRALLKAGESLGVEFKGESRRPLSDKDFVIEAVCLANGTEDPGILLIGVEANGQVTGARPRQGKPPDPRRLEALVANNTVPTLHCRIEVVNLPEGPVIVVQVPRSIAPVCTTEGVYKRRGLGGDGRPGCLPYYVYQMDSRRGALGHFDLSAEPVDAACWEDLNPLELERLRQMILRDRGDQSLLSLSDRDLAKALNLVVSPRGECRPTVGALLLVGRDESLARLVPTHEVMWQVLDEGRRVRANDPFRWPLLRLVDEIMARFRALNHEEEAQVGMWRLPIPDYSEVGFREAVANAVIHRDYGRLGAVHVQWYPDRIEVSNPGGLVEGVRLDNLLVTPPRPRNPALADAFKRVGLVERTGRGIDRIFEGQLRLGRPAPDYGRTTESSVVVVLPGGPTSLAFARFVQECDRKGRPLCLDDLLILNELQQTKRIDVSRARELTQKDEREARKALERLSEAGLIEARGEKRGRVYHLAARVYEALGQREAYVRAVGIEATRWEELIKSYVRRYGRITRSQAAEVCGADPARISRLLRRLVDSGELERRGGGRGTYYRLHQAQERQK